MSANVILFSYQIGEISNFLNKFYSFPQTINDTSLSWEKHFLNPVDISEIVAAFSDNHTSFNIYMWISLDNDVFIKISPANADIVIKYIFERYPY